MSIPVKKLNNGVEMPVVGLGVWKVNPAFIARRAVEDALNVGYRHIDTARIYLNERGVGKAIAQSQIPRQDIFVTTKLWNSDQGYDKTLNAFDKSLDRLGLDYVDLYLIHWPVTGKRLESWRAMEEIYASGRAKTIGVSNFTVRHLDELLGNSKIVPAINQVEFHPFLFQKELMDYCNKHTIALEAYSPLAHGKNIDHPTISKIAEKISQSHVSHLNARQGADEERSESYQVYDERVPQSATTPSTKSADRVPGSARKQASAVRKVSNAQIMLKWSVQHGNIVIPKSTNLERMKENLDLFDFKIENADMQSIDNLNQNLRTCWDPGEVR